MGIEFLEKEMHHPFANDCTKIHFEAVDNFAGYNYEDKGGIRRLA